jgi:hypothetical protein
LMMMKKKKWRLSGNGRNNRGCVMGFVYTNRLPIILCSVWF